ncbi:MAG: hypothetical protein ABIA67_05625 [Candidatus Margulisiibacteriota bacterium]
MNPVARFKIESYQEILREIEKIGNVTYLRDLEHRVIQEIVKLTEEGTKDSRRKLLKLEKMVEEESVTNRRNRFLIATLKNSLRGALSAAKFCVL